MCIRDRDNWVRHQLIEGNRDLTMDVFLTGIWTEMSYYLTATGQAEYQELTALKQLNR